MRAKGNDLCSCYVDQLRLASAVLYCIVMYKPIVFLRYPIILSESSRIVTCMLSIIPQFISGEYPVRSQGLIM